MSVDDYNPLEGDVSAAVENTYCIFLNIVEGVGFLPSDAPHEVGAEDIVLLKVSLNGVLFEVLGNIVPQNSILFNNNCVWECDLDDVKRLKTDNRPIKVECLLKSCCSTKSTTMQIGTLLLPLRSVKIIHCLPKLEIKPVWHKIHNLSYKWRNNRPQIYLMLVIVKKTLLNQVQTPMNLDTHKISSAEGSNNKGHLSSNVSHTLNMLQSQQNIYVQLLEEIGQIQVGSDPQVDCDVFCVTITFKTIKNIASLFDFIQKLNKIQNSSFIFQYDFLGNISNVEIVINNNDCYTINQKISLNFQSSLKSLRLYFQKIFYIPINLYYLNQNIAIASYRFDISQFLPDDYYFDEDTSELWMKTGSFNLNRLNNCISNAKVFKPSIEFMITLELLTKNVNTNPCGSTFFRDQDNYILAHSETSQRTTELEKENLDHVQAVTQYLELKNSLSHQAKNKCILWNASMKRQMNIGENYDSNVYLYNTKTVGVNTERFNASEYDDLLLQFVQDLNNWKQQEMERFMSELRNSKELYLQEIQTRWEDQILRLEAKVIKCEKLNADLQAIQSRETTSIGISMKNIQIANEASKEIQLKYNNVFSGLAERMENLSSKIQENERASTALEERIGCLEKQLTIFQHNILSVSQLRDVLSDMRLQAERFVAMQNFYKKKFRNIELETNLLELKLRKLFNEKAQLKSDAVNCSWFNEILNEEQLASKASACPTPSTRSSPILFEPH